MTATWDFHAVAVAIATQFATVGPPTGLAALSSSTAALPESIGVTPCLLVFPPVGQTDIEYDPSSRSGDFQWTATLFYGLQKDLPRRIADGYAWLSLLYSVFPIASTLPLGLAYARWVRVTSIEMTQAIYPSGSEYKYLVINVGIGTLLGEPVS